MTRLCLVLHAHQPFVRGDGLAEGWLHDAMRDCYTRLLDWIARRRPRITMSVSPTLLTQGFPSLPDGVEWLTTTETHAILPLMRDDDARLRQLTRGKQQFEALTGVAPRGLWLPELAYAPGLEHVILRAGYTQTILALGHGIASGLRCIERDAAISQRIWSRDVGIPGHPLYRDFHKTDASGAKLWRVTDRASDDKAPYDAEAARAQAVADADAVASSLRGDVVAAFDAELFGHWWFEGPIFLEALCERVECIYLSEVPASEPVSPPAASWGEGGDLRTWLQPANAWMLPELHAAQGVAARDERAASALALAESSDWPFMLARGHFAGFAARRFRESLQTFYGLAPQ